MSPGAAQRNCDGLNGSSDWLSRIRTIMTVETAPTEQAEEGDALRVRRFRKSNGAPGRDYRAHQDHCCYGVSDIAAAGQVSKQHGPS